MKKELKNNKGVTLIALVVTIVVLLILAGVSINLVVGDNGIIKKAHDAKKAHEQGSKDEKIELDKWSSFIDDKTFTIAKVSVGSKATENSTINGKKYSAMNPIIPQGYIPINQENAEWGNGTTEPTENSVNNGLVIKDETGNEWVWVPVETPSDLYVKEEVAIPVKDTTSVTTQYYTKSITLGTQNNNRVTPDKTQFREPGIVKNYDNETNIKNAGFSEGKLEQFAQALVNDYKNMIESLEKYHGFYIGRYELSDQGEKQGGTVGNQTWYTAYKQAKNIIPKEAEGKVETRMIWGLQWDATCKWIAKNKGESYNINNSTGYGNHNTNSRIPTGSNPSYKANNIYDLAGNCCEWTQEADDTAFRARRGGSYYSSGSDVPVSSRVSYYTFNSGETYSSRSTLYVK